MLRRFAVPALALPAVLASAAPAHAEDAWDVPGDAVITIDGRGHGHGRGLSQRGAQYAATAEGEAYRAILDHYYPGTSRGTVGGSVRVWISRDTTDDVQVAARTGLTARKVGSSQAWRLSKAKPRASRWRIVPAGRRSALEYRTKGWHRFRQVAGQLELTAGGRPVRLYHGKRSATYRGALRSVPFQDRRLTVNVLPMEAYVRAVVPSEVAASTWHPQAQRAQAVASRSYAAAERAEGGTYYDLDDTPRFQNYLGADQEHPASDRAVRATAREILTYAGRPAATEFTASNGGWTVAGDAPYLPAAEDPWDSDAWGPVTFSDDEIEALWPDLGDLTRIELAGRDGHGEWGGRVGDVTLTGDLDTEPVTGTAFYQRLGLQSSWLTITEVDTP